MSKRNRVVRDERVIEIETPVVGQERQDRHGVSAPDDCFLSILPYHIMSVQYSMYVLSSRVLILCMRGLIKFSYTTYTMPPFRCVPLICVEPPQRPNHYQPLVACWSGHFRTSS